MAKYGLRSSKPHAVLVAVLGSALVIFGIVQFAASGRFDWFFIHGPFIVLWVLFGVGIAGFNLWSAFSRKGATSVLERRD